jgi:hypothetical protein
MARRIVFKADRFRVYLDDVENPNFEEGMDDQRQLPTICKAIELADGEMPDDETATVFEMRSIPLKDSLKVGAAARKGEHEVAIYDMLRKGVVGWTNLLGPDREPLGFAVGVIDQFPLEEANALAVCLMERAQSTSGPRGNV